MVLHICKPNTTCVRSYSVCAHEPVCLLLFKIKMWVDLCILGVVYTEDVINLYISFYLFEPLFDWSFIYVFYLRMFITFLNEDVG